MDAPASLVAVTVMMPLMFLYIATRSAWSTSNPGPRYALDDMAIRWSDTARSWKFSRAFLIERDRRGRPERLKLLFNSGATRTIRLPIDDDALVDRIVAFVAVLLPAYDETTHGPIDLPNDLPGGPTVSLVITSLTGLSLLAMHGRFERRDAAVALRLIFAGSALVPLVWYLIVRRGLNGVQRGRASGYAIAVGMTSLLAGLCVVCIPQARDSIRALRAIPADVRERIEKTITTKPSDSD